ncbi:MAG TPA: 4Fe-4S dicluster domain-containing protein [Pontiella sp.]
MPEYAARIIPALSPLTIVSAAVARRFWYVSLVWSIPAFFVLGLSLWKGRFFCRWICPLGTLYSIPRKGSLKRRFFPWKLNGILFWFIIFSSAVGLPLILFLDPLSTIARIGVLGPGSRNPLAWIPGALIPLILLLCLVQPGIWCEQLCPLGYLVGKLKLKSRTPRQVNQMRRDLIAGLFLGVPLALLLKNTARARKNELPVLPPGALDLDHFASTCVRCYACLKVCPTGVLTVRKKGGVAELCIPELDFDRHDGAYCEQYCHACLRVCPTGAIQSLSIERKQRQKIATASIVREACLGWEDHLECVACDEFCGYKAIEMHLGTNGIPKPIINQRKCRGCGACRNICPATRRGNAVKIEPLYTHKQVTEDDDRSAVQHPET